MDNDYEIRRQRNNDAVRKSREKARERAREVQARIKALRNENEKLEEKLRVRELTRINRWVQTGRALEPKETAC